MPSCPVRDINTDWRCFPDHLGKTCGWYVKETYHTTSAKCADCASGCSEPDGDSCVLLAARTCQEKLIIGCVCSMADLPTTERGTHYVCK